MCEVEEQKTDPLLTYTHTSTHHILQSWSTPPQQASSMLRFLAATERW